MRWSYLENNVLHSGKLLWVDITLTIIFLKTQSSFEVILPWKNVLEDKKLSWGDLNLKKMFLKKKSYYEVTLYWKKYSLKRKAILKWSYLEKKMFFKAQSLSWGDLILIDIDSVRTKEKSWKCTRMFFQRVNCSYIGNYSVKLNWFK